MTQYVSNPTPKTGLTGWSKTAGTLTATADGARWVSSGGYVSVLAGKPGHGNTVNLAGMRIRRNTTASAWPARVWIYSEGRAGGMGVDLRDVDFPVGQWITIPTVGVNNLAYEIGGGVWYDRVWVYVDGPESGTLDCTFDHVTVYDTEVNDGAIDANDGVYSHSGANNSLSRTFSRTSGDECVASVKWTWGDGTTTTGPAAGSGQVSKGRAKTFDSPGVYLVKLDATMPPRGIADVNGTDGPGIPIPSAVTVSSTQSVTVPVGTFEAHYAYETDFLNVVVDATASIAPSLSPIDTYAWDWGDGNTTAASASPYANHTYAAPGTYNITLTVNDTATARTDTEVRAVVANEAPNPDNYFVAVKALLLVSFSPSIQDGTTYLWNFGDGTTSTTKEPTHTYAAPGTYAVTLTVNDSLSATQDVTVAAEYTALGSLLDALRLEVSTPQTGAYNRIKNPSGELGGWGWSTPVTNSYLTGSTTSHETADKAVVGPKLIYRSSGVGTQVIYSSAVSVAAGQYASVQLQSPYVDGYYRATVEALDAAGAVLGSSATTGFQLASPTAVVRTTPYLLPVGTVNARVRLNHYSDTTSGTPTVGKLFQFCRVMLATAATSGALTSLPYAEGTSWVDLLGPTADISITRKELDVGRLSATILDSAYDPATDGRIRPGQTVRLRALSTDLSGNQQWQSVYSGTVDDAQVTYVAAKGPGTPRPKSTRIALTASDAVTNLARIKEPRGVAKIGELPELLESTDVPFSVNGSTAQVPAAQVVAWNPNASALDQVAIARDTDAGYAYVDRSGVLQAREPAYMTTAAVGVVDEAAYANVAAGFNTGNCINSVTVKWLRYTPASGTVGTPEYVEPQVEEVVYGPYEDAASIEEWGRRTATFTMQGVENPTAIEAKAQTVLDANAQPARIITTVDVPIRYVEDLSSSRALLDLYDLTRLKYARTATDELARVVSVTHKIRPVISTKHARRHAWTMTLGFSADGAVASPQVVAPPPPPVAPVAGATGGEATASALLDLTGTETDIAGATLTLNSSGTADVFLVNGSADMMSIGATATTGVVVLHVDGVVRAGSILFSAGALTGVRGTSAQTWRVSGLAAGPHTFKLRGIRSGGANSMIRVNPSHTRLVVQRAA